MTTQHKKRRERISDPFASVAGVRRLCESLRKQCPMLIHKSEKEFVSLLNAVRHLEKYPPTATKSGRPSRWQREDLRTVARELKAILARETQGRISLSSFVGVYLRILRFSTDIASALESGKLNLQEATIMSRVTAERLTITASKSKAIRQQILTAHLQTNGSQNSLRARVQSILGEGAGIVSSETMTGAVQKVDELLEVDPEDMRHLFFEEIRNLFYALKEIEPADVSEEDVARFSQAADQVFTVIQSIRQRRKRLAIPRPFHL